MLLLRYGKKTIFKKLVTWGNEFDTIVRNKNTKLSKDMISIVKKYMHRKNTKILTVDFF